MIVDVLASTEQTYMHTGYAVDILVWKKKLYKNPIYWKS